VKGSFKNKIVHFIGYTLFLTIVLTLLCFWRYIDISVIMAIYLPIWIIGVVATLFGKIIFADVIMFFAGVGLIAEYLVHISNKPYPNMSGAFFNTSILLAGLIAGIMLQILYARKLKKNTSNH
jgi:hypothetical protein